jgi:uncharacterized membrane protein
MTWLLFALLTAFFESLKDITSKRTLRLANEHIVAWAWMALPVPFLLPVVLLQGIPPLGDQFWVALISSGIANTLSLTLYLRAIRVSDLSLTIPMIAFTPLFLLATSPLIVGEFPSGAGVVGILLIVVGSYVLNIKERGKGWAAPYKALLREEGPRLMLVVAFIWSINANIDKVGVLNSAPIFWITAADAMSALFLTPIMLWQTKDRSDLSQNLSPLLLIGFFGAMVGMTQMTALSMTLVAYVISVKRLSILMSVLSGYLIFKEQGVRERLIGGGVMLTGVVVISLLE